MPVRVRALSTKAGKIPRPCVISWSTLHQDALRANDIIGNVRNTIKKGDPTRRRIDLNELVTNVAHVVRPDAVGNSCEVETSLAEDLPSIEGDPVQIQQVLVNLVSNALDAMRHTPPDRRKVEISTDGDGDGEVRLSVRDHGTGIRPGSTRTLVRPVLYHQGAWSGNGTPQLFALSWNLMAVKSMRRTLPMAALTSILLCR